MRVGIGFLASVSTVLLAGLILAGGPKEKKDPPEKISLVLNVPAEELLVLLRKSGMELYTLEGARQKLAERGERLYSLKEAREVLLNDNITNALQTIDIEELVELIRGLGGYVYTEADVREAIRTGKMPPIFVKTLKVTATDIKSALEDALGVPLYFTEKERDRAREKNEK